MISSTYIVSGGLLILTGQLFVNDALSANQMTVAWCLIFFASAGASSAYLCR
jgi:hypothetical protein